jgi:hypothetical protein
MSNEKTSAIIDSCAATFKRTGLLRLAEEPSHATRIPTIVAPSAEPARTYSVTTSHRHCGNSALQGGGMLQDNTALEGNAALDVEFQSLKQPFESGYSGPSTASGFASSKEQIPSGRALGVSALDAFLPDGGLPTGKVTELAMSGGAAWGTRVALWASRAAQEQARLNGMESWCAYIDPSGSLNARGVLSTGVSLSRLLVLRPTLEDVERVVLRLSEARLFSVIVVDLVGVPWVIQRAQESQKTSFSERGRSQRKDAGVSTLTPHKKRQNWPRTVRQLALRLANTQSQVILLTEGNTDVEGGWVSQSRGNLPLPVALRVQMRSERSGVSLRVVKESQGRVGAQVTIPWGTWWGASSETSIPESGETLGSPVNREGRAKPLGVVQTDRVRSLLRPISAEQQARGADIPVVASSRIARSSRASL